MSDLLKKILAETPWIASEGEMVQKAMDGLKELSESQERKEDDIDFAEILVKDMEAALEQARKYRDIVAGKLVK
jgi:hypothetical protein